MSLTSVFVKMHTADPTTGGTAAAAVNATRKALSVGDTLDSAGRFVQDADIAYTGGEVTTTETYAWISYWTAVTGGTWLGNEDIPNQAATAATPLTIVAGTITVTSPDVQEYLLRQAVAGWKFPQSQRRLATWYGAWRNLFYRNRRAKFAKQRAQQAQ